jgi:hypothetical protein
LLILTTVLAVVVRSAIQLAACQLAQGRHTYDSS